MRKNLFRKPAAVEKYHAKDQGVMFDRALAAATMAVRSRSDKLVGCDEIRAAMAWRAALQVTGFAVKRPLLPHPSELQETIDLVFAAAVEAAKRASL